jgi:hypothetical protein
VLIDAFMVISWITGFPMAYTSSKWIYPFISLAIISIDAASGSAVRPHGMSYQSLRTNSQTILLSQWTQSPGLRDANKMGRTTAIKPGLLLHLVVLQPWTYKASQREPTLPPPRASLEREDSATSRSRSFHSPLAATNLVDGRY